jgi:uncharacterized membrane protein
MKSFSVTVDIRAPSDRVLAVLFDIEHWPEWTSTMTSVRRIDGGPLAVGSRARVRQPKLPPAVWKVTEFDKKSGFTWISRSPGVQVAGGHRVEATGTGCRATVSLQFSGLFGPVLARVLRGLNERYLATEAKGLKERAEHQLERKP